MTREEAIKVLNMVEAHGLAEEAKQMAIKALSQEPREDAISRDAAINTVHKMRVVCDTEDIDDYYELLVESFKQLPSVTQKSGKWDKSCTCSVCGQWRILESEKNGGKYKYCPNCGAKMESEDKE